MARGHILGILRLALVPACRDSRGAQEDRGRRHFSKIEKLPTDTFNTSRDHLFLRSTARRAIDPSKTKYKVPPTGSRAGDGTRSIDGRRDDEHEKDKANT
jgi:hypothetical protein